MSESDEIMVKVNGSTTSLFATLNDTDTSVSNLVDVVPVVAGDRITVRSTTSAGCVASDVQVLVRYRK
jgi:hypothetical protein